MKITDKSHTDHELSAAHLAHILETFGTMSGFFIRTTELPASLASVSCNLHGPITGEPEVSESEAHYETRGERAGASRMCDRASVATRLVTVIAGPSGDEPCILYTAFGGPLAPREPFDATIQDNESELAISKAFWAKHALSK